MKLFNFSTVLAIGIVGLFAASCDGTKKEAEKPQEVIKMEFALSVSKTESTSAEIAIRHNGAAKLTWAGFVTEDLVTPAADLVSVEKTKITEADLQIGITKTLTISNLKEETKYRYIAFGIDASKNTYGTPGEAQFETSADLNLVFSVGAPVVDKNSVTVTVSYDKDSDAYTWLGFVTADLTKPVASLVREKVRELDAEEISSGNDKDVTISGLEYETEYRFIVTGILNDGSNTTYGTPAEVSFTTGTEFELATDWTITFEGKEYHNGGWRTLIKVEGTTTPYTLVRLTKAEFEASTVAQIIKADYNAILAEKEQYPDDPLSDWFYSKNSTWYRPYDGPGDYVELIYSVDAEEFALTSLYATVAFSVEGGEATPEYNAWLGTWMASGDVWTISEDVAGETFKISGFLGESEFDIIAGFDPTAHTLSIASQHLGEYENSNYGTCDINLVGWFDYNGSTYYMSGTGSAIAIATLGEDGTASFEAQQAGSYGVYKEIGVYWVIREGEYAGRGNSYYKTRFAVPCTIKRPSEVASDGYSKWLGDWDVVGKSYVDAEVDSTFFNISILEDVKDATFKITGWGGYSQYAEWLYMTQKYNAEDESIIFAGGNDPSKAMALNVNFGDANAYAIYLIGNALLKSKSDTEDEGSVYYITGNVPEICRWNQDPEGTISVTPGAFDNGTYAGEYVYMLMGRWAGTMAQDGTWTNGSSLGGWLSDCPDFSEMKIVKSEVAEPTSLSRKKISFRPLVINSTRSNVAVPLKVAEESGEQAITARGVRPAAL